MDNPKSIWPCINYRDAVAAIDFLERAFAFEATLVHQEGGHVEHAEMRFPEGGGVMLGSARADGTAFERLPVGAAGVYVATDQPDAMYARARAAGAAVVRELRDEPWGQRSFAVSDPEGNIWSFGKYRGATT